MCKKIIAYICCFATVLCFLSPFAFADDYSSSWDTLSFWEKWLYGIDATTLSSGTEFGPIVQYIVGHNEDLHNWIWNGQHVNYVCPNSDDALHHADHLSGPVGDAADLGYTNVHIPAAPAVCKYCGQTFFVDANDIQSAYEDALATNNLSNYGITSSRTVIALPRSSNALHFGSGILGTANGRTYQVVFSDEFSGSPWVGGCIHNKGKSSGTWWNPLVISTVNFSVPTSSYMSKSTRSVNDVMFYVATDGGWSDKYCPFSSDCPILSDDVTMLASTHIDLVILSYYDFYYPSSSSNNASAQQFYTVINNINTTSFNLATVENNQISNVYENTTVINNNNTTFTLPGGSSYPIDSWSFDFDNDRYTLVVLDGELEIPVTVRFGVDDLNIDFDGDTYNYKYVTEAAPHVHTWELTSSTDPTCTGSGSKTYTCSGCNDVRTETVPALGHDWQLVSSVEDHYEADLAACACGDCGSSNVSLASGGVNYFTSEEIGVVCDDCGSTWTILGSFVPGYEVYQCSRCQEEKTVSFGDPVDNSASGFWAWLRIWLENFKTWLGEKLDELLGRENNIIFEPLISPDIQITIPTPDIGFQYADEEGEPDVWHPSDLKEKFAFWADVKDIGTGLYASVQAGGEAPELIIHLGEANSPYGFHYGGDEYALDLSWYGPYKPTVDSITGGFLWLLYLYGVFKNLPNILSGVGMVDNRVQDIQSGTKGGRRRD